MQTEQGSNEGEAPKPELKCISHIGNDNCCEEVKLFSVPILEKRRDKSLVYKFREKSEYANIEILENAVNTKGYHSLCYKKFTAVSAKELFIIKSSYKFIVVTYKQFEQFELKILFV